MASRLPLRAVEKTSSAGADVRLDLHRPTHLSAEVLFCLFMVLLSRTTRRIRSGPCRGRTWPRPPYRRAADCPRPSSVYVPLFSNTYCEDDFWLWSPADTLAALSVRISDAPPLCVTASFGCKQAIVTPEARNKSLDLVSDEEVRRAAQLRGRSTPGPSLLFARLRRVVCVADCSRLSPRVALARHWGAF